ncbi:cyclic nucleotide-binding domain-containing protein [Sideroxydans sp. CL21]|jgi:CRP-like cAMP-binding protein|uniref:cyclic nucleotide-binding domain-containing protein n=1 Tax=Sideroxydans sp. CL21 TaxID=2600596 RepID=UPI0012A9D992|nr:cyclic nucleotide-binding domain-containing protein [Sideroxydans sp. CL21]VVC85406.1 cyclic nucleotide-binding protein [Sideroxydans sp. CL21]
MPTHNLVLQTLNNSTLTEELRDAEIEILARLFEVKEFKSGEALLRPGEERLKNSLIVLASGEVEATATLGGEQATLHLLQPGDLAGIITFAGGNVSQISATVMAKTDCQVLLLERSKFEALLNTQPAIVYYVMRGIVRHTHGIVRRMNTETVEMSNYIYKTKGRF